MRQKQEKIACQCGSRYCEQVARDFEGWISPDGKVFRLAFGHHEIFAEYKLKRSTGRDYKSRAAEALRNLGWVSFGGIAYAPFIAWKEPTQAQLDAIYDLCEEFDIEYPAEFK